MIGIGGWIAALVIGLVLYLVAPHVPPPASNVLRIIGAVLLVIALILFILWIVGLVTGAAVIGSVVLTAS